MNIALSAVLIFILLIPPIAFYFSFSFGRFAKAGPKFSFLDGILASAVFSLFIHTLSLLTISREIRFDILIKLVGGELKDLENKISNAVFLNSLKQFALYNCLIIFLAVLLGRFLRFLVIHFDIHWRHELLRLNNRWWYLFNGYYLRELDLNLAYDLIFVDAAVDTADGTLIYSGYLVDFVSSGEDLDRIYLRNTVRRELKKSITQEGNTVLLNEPGDPIEIPGVIFSLAYANIKNLNLHFLVIDASIEQIQALPEEGIANAQDTE
jgi:hypothetical protein